MARAYVYNDWTLGILWLNNQFEVLHGRITKGGRPSGDCFPVTSQEIRPATPEDFDRIGVMWNDDYLGDEDDNVFVNSRFQKRDYNCTNIVACELLPGYTLPEGYVLATRDKLNGLTPLYIEGNVRYYGYL
jgi:hypothetical protein